MKQFYLYFIFIFLISHAVQVIADDYLLGPGDRILISVYDEPDLKVDVKIDKSGFISFPFMGDIQVIGSTSKEVELKIRDGLLGDYLIDPQVLVSIIAYRPFFIHGQVMRPGGYPYQDDLRLDMAIAVAGGLTARASKSNWKITRIVEGKTITLEANISTKVMADDIIEIEQSFF